jgi:hypothetical protein
MTWEELFKAIKAIFILGLVMILGFYGMFHLLSPHSPTPPTPTQSVSSPAFTQAILDALIHIYLIIFFDKLWLEYRFSAVPGLS